MFETNFNDPSTADRLAANISDPLPTKPRSQSLTFTTSNIILAFELRHSVVAENYPELNQRASV
jgi:hypothetical protein